MGRKHEILRSATAIKRCFRVARSSAKQNQRRGVPEDLEIWPFRPDRGIEEIKQISAEPGVGCPAFGSNSSPA
jgi:hypothetical protein